MKAALTQVSVVIAEEAEECVSAVLEKIFGRTASVYTHAASRKTTASIFLEKSSEWNSRVRAELEKSLAALRATGIELGKTTIAVKKLPRENWAESWKKHFRPIAIGAALLIKPSWSRKLPRKNQACVVLDPGLSFGTGQHATTQFCLQELVRCRDPKRRQSFLDIGTGSGILAIAAAKLGYAPIEAFDFDPEAVRVSADNARHNRVAQKVFPQRRDLAKLPSRSRQKFAVICANLICDLLLQEREKIVHRLAPSGALILAGILGTQFAQVRRAYENMGMKIVASEIGQEWRSGKFIFAAMRNKPLKFF